MIGAGLAMAANLLNPRRVVIGGELAEAGDVLMAPLVAAFERRADMVYGRSAAAVAHGTHAP